MYDIQLKATIKTKLTQLQNETSNRSLNLIASDIRDYEYVLSCIEREETYNHYFWDNEYEITKQQLTTGDIFFYDHEGNKCDFVVVITNVSDEQYKIKCYSLAWWKQNAWTLDHFIYQLPCTKEYADLLVKTFNKTKTIELLNKCL